VNFLYPLEEAKKKWNNQKIAKPHFGREKETTIAAAEMLNFKSFCEEKTKEIVKNQ
jgi:hypothetical protein